MVVKAINVAPPKEAETTVSWPSSKSLVANSTTQAAKLFTSSLKVTFRLLPQINHLAVEQRILVTYVQFNGF